MVASLCRNVPPQCAGGYDSRVAENVEHYNELRGLADKLGVTDHVTFVRSFTDAQKLVLLDRCAGEATLEP
jgi:alpha-1,3/alpha-1,6-mannosyltransferase